MTEIKYVTKNDKEFWFSLDRHLSRNEFIHKVNRKQGYVIFLDKALSQQMVDF